MPTDLPPNPKAPHPGDSAEQRAAEPIMLGLLSAALGIQLAPRRVDLPDGSYVVVDGYSESPPVLAELWAHQGPPKSAQRNKVLVDALKLHHVAIVRGAECRKILCFGSEDASSPFRGTNWYAGAIRELGIEIYVVALPTDTVEAVLAAQRKQYR